MVRPSFRAGVRGAAEQMGFSVWWTGYVLAFVLGAVAGAAMILALVLAPAAEAQTPADPADWGQPPGSTEDVGARGITVKRFNRPDGTKASIFGGQLHWRHNGGEFRDFKPKLTEVGEEITSEGVPYSLQVVKSAAATDCLPQGGVKGCVILRNQAGDRGIAWKLGVKPVFVDSTHVEFSKGLFTCQYELGRRGAKLTCPITSNVGVFTHTWNYALLGGEPDPTEGADGSVVFSFAKQPPLTARDDLGNTVSVPWSVNAATDEISATLDDSTLTAPYVIE